MYETRLVVLYDWRNFPTRHMVFLIRFHENWMFRCRPTLFFERKLPAEEPEFLVSLDENSHVTVDMYEVLSST